MGAGSGETSDPGLFGWRDWKLPKHPFHVWETTPSPKTDGSYDPLDYKREKAPEKWKPLGNEYNPVRYPNLSPYWSMFFYMNHTPIKTVFSEFSGSLAQCSGGRCEKFELQAMECMEYYGLKQGMVACKDWYDDLMECKTKTKRNLRVKHMRQKRRVEYGLEYLQGKRDKMFEDPPKFHGFFSPELDPQNVWENGTTT